MSEKGALNGKIGNLSGLNPKCGFSGILTNASVPSNYFIITDVSGCIDRNLKR